MLSTEHTQTQSIMKYINQQKPVKLMLKLAQIKHYKTIVET